MRDAFLQIRNWRHDRLTEQTFLLNVNRCIKCKCWVGRVQIYEALLSAPERDGLEGEARSWRMRRDDGRGRRVHGHRHWQRHRVRRRRQRAVRRRRHALQQVGGARRPRTPRPPPPRRLLGLALRARYTPLPLGLHGTVHITTGCILHLHYVHVHTGHVLSARLARDAHRDRVRLAQRGGRRHGQPHLVAGSDRAVRRARMTTAVRRLGREGGRGDPPAEGRRARQFAIGARAGERRRAALVGLPEQRGERLGGGQRRLRIQRAAHLATALRCRASAVTRHPPPLVPGNKQFHRSLFSDS